MRSLIVYSLLLLCLVSACETDFEVNAPWRDITVVYGLLNQNDSVHYVKINRAFLGKENAQVMAAERDSSEYVPSDITVTIEEKVSTNPLTYSLTPVQDSNKQSGVFYAPNHTLYSFVETNLDPSSEYKLVIKKNKTGEAVSASTPLIQNFKFANTGFWNASKPKVNFFHNGQYQTFTQGKWKSAINGRRYQMTITFHYYEKPAGQPGPISHRTLDWVFPTQKAPDLNGGDEIGADINGEDFYKYVANKLKPISTSNNIDRCISGLDFMVTVGGEDLNTYLDVNEPSTGIVQERPEFTNVFDGNGKEQAGIFSSRFSIIEEGAVLSESGQVTNSITELKSGQYTTGYGFTDTVDDPTCPQ